MNATDKPANDDPANDDRANNNRANNAGAAKDDGPAGQEPADEAVAVVNEYDQGEYDLAAGAAAYARAQGDGSDGPPDAAGAGAAGDPPAQDGAAGAESGAAETEAALLAENRELREQALRTLAEMDNLRKRTAREKEDAAKFAISKFAKDLLTVGDNLQRALQAIPEGAAADTPLLLTLADGVAAVERELDTVLERHGVRKVEALGAPFDAHVHQAVMEQPTADVPAGHVAQVFQTGYLLNDRLLRPAMVAVAKAP